jgi:pentatricopeptide repeat protein
MLNWLLRTRYLSHPLRSTRQATLVLLGMALAAVLIGGVSIRVGISSTGGASIGALELRRAIALDPGNPALQNRLGLVYCYSPGQFDPVEGLKYLRKAVELNGYKAGYWADLGLACESVGDLTCADQSFRRALSVSPMMPRLEWITANYCLRTNQVDAAIKHFQRLLELSPEYASTTFNTCLRALGNPELILQKVLPSGTNPALKLQYADFLSTHGEADFSYRVWLEAVAPARLFPFSLARAYLEHLLDLGRYKEAFDVWQDMVRLGIVDQSLSQESDNLVFNSSFEQVPLDSGFDWHYWAAPYVSLDFSDSRAYEGARCLRLDFTVKQNEDYEPVTQIVRVDPGQVYSVRAYTRSENVTSDSGPRLRVVDVECPSCLNLATEASIGTTPWHPVSMKFTAGPQTSFLRLSVWRPRSRTFPTEITGSFWVDSVSLKRVSAISEVEQR